MRRMMAGLLTLLGLLAATSACAHPVRERLDSIPEESVNMGLGPFSLFRLSPDREHEFAWHLLDMGLAELAKFERSDGDSDAFELIRLPILGPVYGFERDGNRQTHTLLGLLELSWR